jgi:phosphopentomutase
VGGPGKNTSALSKSRKAILIVLDGVGVGELPDAHLYGDSGSNTLANTARAVGGLRLPTLQELGLGCIVQVKGVPPIERPRAHFGKMAEVSAGKDSTTGHWELAGLTVLKEFPTFPLGFPADLMKTFLRVTGAKGFLGNKTASGTAIIEELGEEHLRSGLPIVYTSADSVFQIAAHEVVIPLGELYEMCRKTREEVCVGEFTVGRVIARPFIGDAGSFTRTTSRKDFSLDPFGTTLLDVLHRSGIETVGIGKIDDLFARRGLSRMVHTRTNPEGMEEIRATAGGLRRGLIFANLGDFDTLYGHRNDAQGFARALEGFDAQLPGVLETLAAEDMLILTADHGNDPVTPSTDHSREYVPLLCLYGGGTGRDLGTRKTFADAGKTIADFFDVRNHLDGTSFLSEVWR